MLEHIITVFLGFFAIMNPIANTAVFVGLTNGVSPNEQKRVAFKSVTTAFAIVALFSLFGKGIFELFGITLPALRITGGVLVFLVGYHMLQGATSKMHHPLPKDKTIGKEEDSAVDNSKLDIAISPLAIPILAGPGTIATAMNFSAAGGVAKITTTILVFMALCLLTYVAFVFSERTVKIVGDKGLDIVSRLMGLILAVIGTQMLIQGIREAMTIAIT